MQGFIMKIGLQTLVVYVPGGLRPVARYYLVGNDSVDVPDDGMKVKIRCIVGSNAVTQIEFVNLLEEIEK